MVLRLVAGGIDVFGVTYRARETDPRQGGIIAAAPVFAILASCHVL